MIQHDIVKWLKAIPSVLHAVPCTITIKGTSYAAARYAENVTISPGCDAYARGERQYTREAIYVLGPLPKHYQRRRKAAYVVQGDTREWYIAGYWDGRPNPFNPGTERDYHPFGKNFILAPWTFSEAIDQYETHKYDRVALSVVDV